MIRSGLALWLLFGASGAHAADMIALRYLDQDPGDPSYPTRILVTPDFLRMDSGEDDGDFVLLDRRQQKVINVMRANRIAMVFTLGRIPARPASWKTRLTARKGEAGTQRYKLVVNAVTCSEGVAAARSQDAANAMAEMKAILAATQYRVWKDSPREMQHDCDLANQVWETGASLKLGLPLREREFTGRTRQLEQESKQPLRPELFRLPEGLATVDAPS